MSSVPPVPSSASGSGSGSGSSRAQALAERAAAGDELALEELLREIEPEVLRRTARFLPNRQDAEEAAQDALLQVARRISSFEGRSKFSTWLYVVVANAARATYRDLKRRSVEQPLSPREDDRRDARTTSVIAGSRIDLLEALDQLERSKPQLVAPLVYRDLLDLEYEEIATRLGLPLGTVKSRLHQARQEVRRYLIEKS